MIKLLSVLIAVVLFFTQIPHAAKADKLMTDISGDEWFAEDVRLLVEMGIINGFPDGSFRPNAPFKVDEFLKSLVLALHYEPSETKSDYWAQGYIDTAKSLFWLEYISADKELKDYTVPITREQMGVVLYAAVRDIPGVQMNGGRVNLMYKGSEYERGIWIDAKSSIEGVGTYDFLLTIYGLGLITGYPNGEFGNRRNLTRAEAAAVLARIVDPSRRIYPDVGFTPPHTGKVETEGIEFDYNKDLIKEETDNRVDYYMSKEMQEYFALIHLKSFQISKDGTVKFYMPDLPEGFEAHNSVTVQYKEGVKGEHINNKWCTQTLFGTAENIPPLKDGNWYEYKAEKDFKYIKHISIYYSITYSEYYQKNSWYNYSFYYEFPMKYYDQYDMDTKHNNEKEIPWEVKFCE